MKVRFVIFHENLGNVQVKCDYKLVFIDYNRLWSRGKHCKTRKFHPRRETYILSEFQILLIFPRYFKDFTAGLHQLRLVVYCETRTWAYLLIKAAISSHYDFSLKYRNQREEQVRQF